MNSLLLIAIFFLSGQAMAQNMANREKKSEAYVKQTDGSKLYVGRCTTHEHLEKNYVIKGHDLQLPVKIADLDEAGRAKVIKNIGEDLLMQAAISLRLTAPALNESLDTILYEMVQEIQLTPMGHNLWDGIRLVRFNVLTGGKRYYVVMKVDETKKDQYQLMSQTYEGQIEYCDKEVWLTDKMKEKTEEP